MCCTSITKYKTFSRFIVIKYLTVSDVLIGRGKFTFNSLFIVVLMYLVVPLYSHATKSTSISLKLHQTPKIIRATSSDKNLTIPYPNSYPKNHNKINYLHTISPLLYLTPPLHSNPNKSNTNKQIII